MSASNELRVFISSTFRDLQEEREHLVKKIFPEIRALCRERGVTFTDVDLRWGLTEEEANLGRIIRTCLEEVDKCRPYFIGMIGSRYGWVPELHEILMDPDLLGKYPFVEDLAIDGASVTEMEFIHGIFDAPSAEGSPGRIDGEYAFFYQRSGRITESDDPERLGSLIERARSSGQPYREFTSVEELGDVVRADLVAMIEANWPETEAPTELDLERRAHAAFAASRTRAYIPNPFYLKAFSTWLAEGETPLVITGASGLGKSSLVAYLTEHYHKKNRDAFIIAHYVGASQSSGTALSVMRHIVEAIRVRFDIDEEIPSKPDALQRSFPNWLFRCEHLAKKAGVGVLIVIDAVNQLDESGRRMSWLPETIPSGVRLLVSTTPGEAADRLSERAWDELQVEPLEDQRIRQSIIVRYLGEFRKGVSPAQLRSVIEDEKARSPLYLRVVAEELRLHGEHETLDEVIERYTSAADLLAVFDLVLERMEVDYGEQTVCELLSLIGSSRAGLSEDELLGLLTVNRLDLSRLLFALDYHLLQRNGLLGFFHDYLRRAVEKRYLMKGSSREERYRILADYFEGGDVTLRRSLELLHALEAMGDHEGLKYALSDIERFLDLWKSEGQKVLQLWSSIDLTEIVEAHQGGVDRWEQQERSSHERLEVLNLIAMLYDRVGAWSAAEDVQRRCLDLARESGDREVQTSTLASLSSLVRQLGRIDEAERLSRESDQIAREMEDRSSIAHAAGSRGVVHMERGEYTEALDCFRETEQIVREMGDRRGIAFAVGNRGIVHKERGEYTEALDCFREQEQIAREMGDRRGIASPLCNRGLVHKERGEYMEALDCFREQEQIAREMGDRRNIALAVGNRGTLHSSRGEYPEALDCFREQEQIAREIGDRSSIADAIGNRGLVHSSRGEYPEALDCYREQEQIAREKGDRNRIAIVVGNRGDVHADCREYPEALDCFRQAAEESREIGFRLGLCHWLLGSGRTLLELVAAGSQPTPLEQMPECLQEYLPDAKPESWHVVTLQAAREHAEECAAISEELSIPDTLFSGRLLLARIEAAEGDSDRATRQLETMLDASTDSEQQADLHYWLWKLGAPGHLASALAIYEEIYQSTPKHEVHLRIEELKVAATPT